MNSVNEKIACPDCGESSFYALADKRLMCRQCRKKFTPCIKPFRIDEEAQIGIISFFMGDVSAESAAKNLKINRKTLQKYYRHIRSKISRECERFEDSFFFGHEKKIDNLQETNFCITSINERIVIFSMKKYESIISEGHSLPLYYYIDAVRKKNTRHFEIFIRQGTTQQNEKSLKFKTFFLRSMADIKINNFNCIYYQLKEIEYKFNKANSVDNLLNLESIIN